MSWKHDLRVGDLEPQQRLEMRCRRCGHVHYLTRDLVCVSPEREFLSLDELEKETICRAAGCRGQVRLSLVRSGTTSGFVGGLA